MLPASMSNISNCLRSLRRRRRAAHTFLVAGSAPCRRRKEAWWTRWRRARPRPALPGFLEWCPSSLPSLSLGLRLPPFLSFWWPCFASPARPGCGVSSERGCVTQKIGEGTLTFNSTLSVSNPRGVGGGAEKAATGVGGGGFVAVGTLRHNRERGGRADGRDEQACATRRRPMFSPLSSPSSLPPLTLRSPAPLIRIISTSSSPLLGFASPPLLSVSPARAYRPDDLPRQSDNQPILRPVSPLLFPSTINK